jgi:RimJ/RimL family protein N-acetyltransferase
MLQEKELVGERVRLLPLRSEHAGSLWEAAQSPEIWSYFPFIIGSLDEMKRFISVASEAHSRGVELPFAVVDQISGRLVGSTRFMDFNSVNRSAEIGATWLCPDAWRTRINTECKFLLLQHGFETLGLVRIFFKTDARNERSQRAIERLGAQREGRLRKHMILAGGFVRDSVYYSILDDEWPDVKARLQGFLSN